MDPTDFIRLYVEILANALSNFLFVSVFLAFYPRYLLT